MKPYIPLETKKQIRDLEDREKDNKKLHNARIYY